MSASEADKDRSDLISRMFALLTAKLEDAAAIAAHCQGKRPVEELREGGAKLRETIGELATLIEGTIALLGQAGGPIPVE